MWICLAYVSSVISYRERHSAAVNTLVRSNMATFFSAMKPSAVHHALILRKAAVARRPIRRCNSLPLKMMRPWACKVSATISRTTAENIVRTFQFVGKIVRHVGHVAFVTAFKGRCFWLAPTMRNSKFIASESERRGAIAVGIIQLCKSGRLFTPAQKRAALPCSAWPRQAPSMRQCVAQEDTHPTAGGAFFVAAKAFVARQLAERRSRSAYLSTAVSNRGVNSVTRKQGFPRFVGGFQKIFCSYYDDAQLLCLPPPFTPAALFRAAGTQNCGAELPCASAPS